MKKDQVKSEVEVLHLYRWFTHTHPSFTHNLSHINSFTHASFNTQTPTRNIAIHTNTPLPRATLSHITCTHTHQCHLQLFHAHTHNLSHTHTILSHTALSHTQFFYTICLPTISYILSPSHCHICFEFVGGS